MAQAKLDLLTALIIGRSHGIEGRPPETKFDTCRECHISLERDDDGHSVCPRCGLLSQAVQVANDTILRPRSESARRPRIDGTGYEKRIIELLQTRMPQLRAGMVTDVIAGFTNLREAMKRTSLIKPLRGTLVIGAVGACVMETIADAVNAGHLSVVDGLAILEPQDIAAALCIPGKRVADAAYILECLRQLKCIGGHIGQNRPSQEYVRTSVAALVMRVVQRLHGFATLDPKFDDLAENLRSAAIPIIRFATALADITRPTVLGGQSFMLASRIVAAVIVAANLHNVQIPTNAVVLATTVARTTYNKCAGVMIEYSRSPTIQRLGVILDNKDQ